MLQKNAGNGCNSFWAIICLTMLAMACYQATPMNVADPNEELIARGQKIFFNETFDGNGRTCGTCHRAENNFTIDPEFIATLPDNDPLFVAEFNPDLKEHFENPNLMRKFGLILENANGFDDIAHNFVLRGVPHILGLRCSVPSEMGPLTGWSGDGAPGDASLRAFAAGAVIQHFPKTLNRIPGVDFRLPTEAELDALAAFQLSLGRQTELTSPLSLQSRPASRGQAIFNDAARGKCFICHFRGGANGDPVIFGQNAGNLNFNTGVEGFSDRLQDPPGEPMPPDDGFGAPGDGTFNTPSLIEAADTAPYFHNNAVETLEEAVAFYNSDAFNNSPAGQSIKTETGSRINLDAAQVAEVAGFLRVLNALENSRQSIRLLENYLLNNSLTARQGKELLRRAIADIRDAQKVLKNGGLHPEAVVLLTEAERSAKKALHSIFVKDRYVRAAIEMLEKARHELLLTSDS